MKREFTLLTLSVLLATCAFAARPTIHASNLAFSNLQCNSVRLSWTNGNGNARLIAAREGAAPDFVPADQTVYSANPNFGKSLKYGSGYDNYIVYNGNDTNYVIIDSLKTGKTYYFTIYEHDNSGSSTLYYTAGVPTNSIKTYIINPDFKVVTYDSCQAHNKYEFTNTSTSDIPGISYLFDFDDGDTSSASPVFHSYKKASPINAKIKAITSITGCKTVFAKPVRVYQKKMAYIDWALGHDTVQCFRNNLFKFYTGNYTNPLSGSYGYKWHYKDVSDSIQLYTFFRAKFETSGRHKISLEISTNISKGANIYPTGCKDTLNFDIVVHPNATKNISVNSNLQKIDTNRFIFSNIDSNLVSQAWYFGDGDSSNLQRDTHTYVDTGSYLVTFKGHDTKGCYHEKTMKVTVFLVQPPASISSVLMNSRIRVYPNPSSGRLLAESGGQAITMVCIYDMKGVKVREMVVKELTRAVEIDLQDLQSGHYMVRVNTEDSASAKMIQLLR